MSHVGVKHMLCFTMAVARIVKKKELQNLNSAISNIYLQWVRIFLRQIISYSNRLKYLSGKSSCSFKRILLSTSHN